MSNTICLLFIAVLLLGCEKQLSGKVVDCTTDASISDAIVSTNQSGWGVSNGQIVWDKTYVTETQTNKSGLFELVFDVGSSAKIHVSKKGYYSAEQFEYPSAEIIIKLLPGDNPIEFTHHCRLVSDCVNCAEVGGVLECQDTCTEPD